MTSSAGESSPRGSRGPSATAVPLAMAAAVGVAIGVAVAVTVAMTRWAPQSQLSSQTPGPAHDQAHDQAPGPAHDPRHAQIHDEIAAVLQAQATAWNHGDLDGFMSAYERSDDLLFTSAAKLRRGWQATYNSYQARYFSGSDAPSRGHLAFQLLELRPLGDSAAVVLGEWTLTDTPQAGHGVFTLVFERHDQQWRIVHDHTSLATSP